MAMTNLIPPISGKLPVLFVDTNTLITLAKSHQLDALLNSGRDVYLTGQVKDEAVRQSGVGKSGTVYRFPFRQALE
jgi:hypothetical protein